MENTIANRQSLFALSLILNLYIFGLIVYRLLFHPLAKFPGPRLAAITRYYEAYYDILKGGQYTFKIAELHKDYGPIIRISPYELHVIDPSFYEKIYKQDGRWERYLWMYRAFGAPGSTICTTDHGLHKRRRASLNPFFSKAKVATREDIIQTRIQKFSSRLDDFASSGLVLHLGFAYTAMTMDIVTAYTIGKSYGNLDQKDFNQGIMECIQGSGVIWRLAKHFPWLTPIFAGMPTWMVKMLDEKGAQFKAFQEDCIIQIQRIMSANETGSVEEKWHNTLVYEILQSPDLPLSEKSFTRINDEVQTIAGAGLETTAHTLRVITYHVYNNTVILHRLRAELTDHSNSQSSSTKWTLRQLEQLPYLKAVIMEGLRINPGVATRLARIAPDRDLVFGEWVIPAGTPVGMTTLLMHHDENLYPHPRSFDPERWMDTTGERKVEKVYAPFSRGTMNCVGMHLAWAELYLTVAAVVSSFDFEFAGTELGDVECGSDQYAMGTKKKNGVKVVVKRAGGN